MVASTNDPVLILGTAPQEYVRECLDRQASLGGPVTVLVREGNEAAFQDVQASVVTFRGYLKPWNPALARLFGRLRPSRCVVVCGRDYFHDNVIRSLEILSWWFGHHCDIDLSVDKQPVLTQSRYHRQKPGYQFRTVLWNLGFYATLASFAGGAAFAAVRFGVVAPLLAAVTAGLACLEVGGRLVARNSRWFQVQPDEGGGAITPLRRKFRYQHYERQCPVKGWRLLPDVSFAVEERVPQLGWSHDWRYSTDSLGARRSRDGEADREPPVVLLFGCSITWGAGVHDEETFAWKLQERFPGHRIVNLGVNAYSLCQMHLALLEALPAYNPAVVVFCVHDDLGVRSTLPLDRLADCLYYLRPTCRVRGGKLQLQKPRRYEKLWLARRSVAIRLAEIGLNALRSVGRGNPKRVSRTARLLMLESRKETEKAGARFMLAYLDAASYANDFEFLKKNSFNVCAAPMDYKDDEAKVRLTNIHLYLDYHPNAAGHMLLAQVIGKALEELLRTGRTRPQVEDWHVKGLAGEEHGERRFIYPHY